MNSDFLRRILLSPVNPISLNIISYMTDLGEMENKTTKTETGRL
jgi:hypothetical protein